MSCYNPNINKGLLAQIQENRTIEIKSDAPVDFEKRFEGLLNTPKTNYKPQIAIGIQTLMGLGKDKIQAILNNYEILTDFKGYEYLQSLDLK
jgi:hypothetical protein